MAEPSGNQGQPETDPPEPSVDPPEKDSYFSLISEIKLRLSEKVWEIDDESWCIFQDPFFYDRGGKAAKEIRNDIIEVVIEEMVEPVIIDDKPFRRMVKSAFRRAVDQRLQSEKEVLEKNAEKMKRAQFERMMMEAMKKDSTAATAGGSESSAGDGFEGASEVIMSDAKEDCEQEEEGLGAEGAGEEKDEEEE